MLIVDDEPFIRELLEAEFTDHHADVTTASSGESALQLLLSKKFDILFTDLKMANGDGLWLLEEVNKQLTELPIIFLCSGYINKSTEELKQLGVVKTISKPFDFEHVVANVMNEVNLITA